MMSVVIFSTLWDCGREFPRYIGAVGCVRRDGGEGMTQEARGGGGGGVGV